MKLPSSARAFGSGTNLRGLPGDLEPDKAHDDIAPSENVFNLAFWFFNPAVVDKFQTIINVCYHLHFFDAVFHGRCSNAFKHEGYRIQI